LAATFVALLDTPVASALSAGGAGAARGRSAVGSIIAEATGGEDLIHIGYSQQDESDSQRDGGVGECSEGAENYRDKAELAERRVPGPSRSNLAVVR
jgi:hypothetical protein